MPDVYEQLKKLGKDDSAAVYLNEPCGADCLENFRRRLRDELKENADWYIKLLQVTDGLQIDNTVFDSAEDFIETNLELRAEDNSYKRFLIFGNGGNTDRYVYDRERPGKPFLVANFFGDFSDDAEIYEEYASLEDLLKVLLEKTSD